MPGEWDQLNREVQDYWRDRFAQYGIDGEEAYDQLLSEEAKQLGPDELQAFLGYKDISHIVPRSEDPELADDLTNVYLEDAAVNRARGAVHSTEEEIAAAWEDQEIDAENLLSGAGYEVDDSLLEEVLGASVLLSFFNSAHSLGQEMAIGDLKLEEAPRYFTLKLAGRTWRYVVVSTCLTSGHIVLVSGMAAFLFYGRRAQILKLLSAGKDLIFHNDITDCKELAQFYQAGLLNRKRWSHLATKARIGIVKYGKDSYQGFKILGQALQAKDIPKLQDQVSEKTSSMVCRFKVGKLKL